MLSSAADVSQVWYAAYGSNLQRERFLLYIRGGRATGSHRVLPGVRDTRDPTGDRALTLPGRVRFGWTSPTWRGGIAFYDPDLDGRAFARAYRITAAQFADLAAQEMHTDPGHGLDLATVLSQGRHSHGPGHYETLHLVGELNGLPVLTFSASSWREIPPNQPSADYLAIMWRGLRTTHGLDADACADHLLACPGIGTWTHAQLCRLDRRCQPQPPRLASSSERTPRPAGPATMARARSVPGGGIHDPAGRQHRQRGPTVDP